MFDPNVMLIKTIRPIDGEIVKCWYEYYGGIHQATPTTGLPRPFRAKPELICRNTGMKDAQGQYIYDGDACRDAQGKIYMARENGAGWQIKTKDGTERNAGDVTAFGSVILDADIKRLYEGGT
jgi:hypothetical protein